MEKKRMSFISEESTHSSLLIYESEKSSIPSFPSQKSSMHTVKNHYQTQKSKYGRFSELTLLHHSPIIKVRKPKSLIGPYDVYDLPEIRDAVSKHLKLKNDSERRKLDKINSVKFVEDLNLTDYFINQKNWSNKTKYINTRTLHKAMETYLPSIKKTTIKEPLTRPIDFEKDLFDLKNEKKSRKDFDLNLRINLSRDRKTNFSSGDWF
jgi:hypothetical protein